MRTPRLHLPTVVGRLRSDRGLLLLVGTVVALTVALMGAVSPVTVWSADRAMAAVVQDAGCAAPSWPPCPSGTTTRRARRATPAPLRTSARTRTSCAAACRATSRRCCSRGSPPSPPLPCTSSTPPGRYLRFAFVDTAAGVPDVSYTRGAAPQAARGGARRPSVQVAVSEAAAQALDLQVGERIPLATSTQVRRRRDQPHLRARRRGRRGLGGGPPPARADHEHVRGRAAHHHGRPSSRTSRCADLRLALPGDALSRRVVVAPEPAAVTSGRSASLERTIAALQSGAGVGLERDVLGQPARHRAARRTCAGQRRTRSGAGPPRGAARLRAARPRAGRTAAGTQTRRGVDRGPGARRLPARHRRELLPSPCW